MLRPDGFVKVLDFGLAKLTEVKARDWDILRTSDGESGKTTLPLSHSPLLTWATRPGMLMGTVAYMPPEQARGLEVDARSDLFSLGVVLYEMLTGGRPFTGETPTDVLAALIEREPPPLPGLLPEKADAVVRAELQRVVSQTLTKQIDKRKQGTRETFMRALDCFNQAIALDPRYAQAYAGIANIYAVFSSQYLPPSEAMPKARAAALKAITLNESLPEAHLALALVKLWGDWDLAGAEQQCKRAIELNPNFVEAISFYSGILQYQGRFDEALRAARHAEVLDILSPSTTLQVCAVLYYSRQYDRLIEESRKALDLNPTGNYASGMHLRMGLTFSHKQMHQEAIAEMLQVVAQTRSDSNLSWLAYVYARAGRKREALEILHELEAQAARRHVPPVSIAKMYVGLSDKERALTWLRKAYDQRSDHVLILGVDPIYDPLRSDPRFIEMLRGMGLAPRAVG
jgi:tetratricopeptide (TPR) repeat protein